MSELVVYFAECEEEVNNVLIGEALKKTSIELENEGSQAMEKINVEELSRVPIKRVHFAPLSNEIETILNSSNDSLLDMFDEDKQVTKKLKTDLDNCLKRLKSEAAQLLEISVMPDDVKLDLISRKMSWTSKLNEELTAKLESAENQVSKHQQETEACRAKIVHLQEKLIDYEKKKEIIAEGYGEREELGEGSIDQDYMHLQDKGNILFKFPSFFFCTFDL